jgi:hypothetical protein
MIKRNVLLTLVILAPCFWACIVDTAVTVLHQSSEYWKGDLTKANEANPLGSVAMRNHPSGIFVLTLAWFILIGVVGYLLPITLLRIFSLAIVMGHTVGAATWLMKFYGFWYVIILVIVNAVLYISMDEVYRKKLRLVTNL